MTPQTHQDSNRNKSDQPKKPPSRLRMQNSVAQEDDFYTYEIVQVGCPSKWFEKTSGTRVYLKDNGNVKRQQIERRLKDFVSRSEAKRDKFLLREILRKNYWKYKKSDYGEERVEKHG